MLEGNRARDQRVNRALRAAGWRVVRIWEHELAKRNEARLVACLHRVLALTSPRLFRLPRSALCV